ncbi:MAG: hypothetical protein JW860_10695 [Sedimentisphaerales bacterium]|nr:hypothetical protein [Sedimentisphaerales bacterium]
MAPTPNRGLVLVELVVIFFIITLFLVFVAPASFELIRQYRLQADVARFARTLRTAAEMAVMQGEPLEVIIDVTDGYYTVYEQEALEDSNDFPEPLIREQGLDWCYITQIHFDDTSSQYSGELALQATPQGWSRSVVFDLIDDRDQRLRYVSCDRMTTRVIVDNQPPDLPEAQTEVSMTSPL